VRRTVNSILVFIRPSEMVEGALGNVIIMEGLHPRGDVDPRDRTNDIGGAGIWINAHVGTCSCAARAFSVSEKAAGNDPLCAYGSCPIVVETVVRTLWVAVGPAR
jgi:hypothetical protein